MKNICWNITSRCNKNCNYCFKFNRKELSLEENIKILEELKKRNIKKISWSGGEPFLYENINVLLKRSHENGILNYVNTNASLLDCNNIKENLLYVDKIIISLDFVNDSMNFKKGIGKNYYENVKKVIELIRLIDKYTIIQINTVLYSDNFYLIDDLYNELKMLDIDMWKIIRFFPVRGIALERKESLEVKDADFKRIVAKYSKKKQKFNIVIHGLNEMKKRHYIILSSGKLICSENGLDLEIEDLNKEVLF